MDCIFCKIVSGEIPATKVYEDDAVVAFIDIKPIHAGHLLVVPRAHSADVREADDAAVAAAFTTARDVGAAIVRGLGADGFNIGVNTGAAAGQIVMHTHVHVIPRYADDGLEHWAKDDVTPEQLQEAADKITEALSAR